MKSVNVAGPCLEFLLIILIKVLGVAGPSSHDPGRLIWD